MRFLDFNYVTESATVITPSSEDVNFPASNLKNPLRSKVLRTTGVDDQSVVFDLITSEYINSVVVLWPKENGVKLSNSVNLRIQANATNEWSSPAVDQVLTVDNTYEVASHFFSGNGGSYRYWRLFIDDPTNPYDYIEIGMVWLGLSIDIDNAQNGFKYQLEDTSIINRNDFGHEYVDEYPTIATLDISYQYLDYDVIKVLEETFRRNGTRKPVIFIADETDDIFDKDHFLLYGKMGKSFGMGHVMFKIFNQDGIKFRELS